MKSKTSKLLDWWKPAYADERGGDEEDEFEEEVERARAMIRLLIRWVSLRVALVESWWALRRLRSAGLVRAGEYLPAGTMVALDARGRARVAGLAVPRSTLGGSERWLQSATAETDDNGVEWFRVRGAPFPGSAMTLDVTTFDVTTVDMTTFDVTTFDMTTPDATTPDAAAATNGLVVRHG